MSKIKFSGIGPEYNVTYVRTNKDAIAQLVKPGYKGVIASIAGGPWKRYKVSDFIGWPGEIMLNHAVQAEARKIASKYVVDRHKLA